MSFIPYGRQDISEEDIASVVEALRSDLITQGPLVKKFENALCEYTGSKYAVVFNSGTSALHGSYFACGLKVDDKIITSPITFVATSNAALYLNAIPIFTDIEPTTGNLSFDSLEGMMNENPKIVVPVAYSGQPCDNNNIYNLAKENGCFVVEDATHSIGSIYNNYKTGSGKYADITVFSFHPVKIVTTGEGGAAVTNDEKLYQKLIKFRSHGITKSNLKNVSPGPWYYEMQDLGFNYRITEIQAALGLSQIIKINEFVERRNQIAKVYNKAFSEAEKFDTLIQKPDRISSYHLYPILIKKEYKQFKKNIYEAYHQHKIGVQCHYIPVNSQPYYRKLGYSTESTSYAVDFYEREISLPIYYSLNQSEQQRVIDITFSIFESLSKKHSQLTDE